eukprot:RCo002486
MSWKRWGHVTVRQCTATLRQRRHGFWMLWCDVSRPLVCYVVPRLRTGVPFERISVVCWLAAHKKEKFYYGRTDPLYGIYGRLAETEKLNLSGCGSALTSSHNNVV